MATSADDFFEQVRQLCEINNLQGFWERVSEQYEQIMIENHYVLGLDQPSQVKIIMKVIDEYT